VSKVWFITGSSRGFGREFAEAALARGDRVAATARDPAAVSDLVERHGDAVLPLELDVTDRARAVAAVGEAVEHFGRLDIVVNNAGFGMFGAVEELTEAELREQFETNFFGVVWVTQAVVPVLRDQGSGHIVQMSSLSGLTAAPLFGAYHASKWALEGLCDALAQEVAGFGVKVTIVEPQLFSTDWDAHSTRQAGPLEPYEPLRRQLAEWLPSLQYGDPKAAAQVLLEIVDADEPPTRILFGAYASEYVPSVYAERVEGWKAWEDRARAASG
jgi:NAD(P)-dependent dehydrogenase (short-subunit alcohol dehydrogenase family)